MTLDLSSLGLELDNVRRARRGEPPIVEMPEMPETPDVQDVPELHDAAIDSSFDSSSSASQSPPSTTSPLPLCLLCFARPPSAVLLPCAHLNLCYLCAPLFMLKSCKREPERIELDQERAGRVPYNVALSRALAKAPGARRLSAGGYMHKEGHGELRGSDLLNGKGVEVDGRVSLPLDTPQAAQCLVCRGGVSGWLRVYT